MSLKIHIQEIDYKNGMYVLVTEYIAFDFQAANSPLHNIQYQTLRLLGSLASWSFKSDPFPSRQLYVQS